MEMVGGETHMMPKVALIYLTYHIPASDEDISKCLQSLEKIDYPQEDWQIIFVENPSPHGQSFPMIERDWGDKFGKTLPKMQLIKNQGDMGYAGAENIGFAAAVQQGVDYVYLLNQDASVDPSFLRKIVAYAEAHPQAAVLQSRIMLQQTPVLLNTQGNALHFLGFGFCDGYRKTPEVAAKSALKMFYASGAGVLIRVAAAKHIGLFVSEYYMYHEDVDLSWRARLAGYGVAYVPDSVIYHRYEFSRSIKKFYWMERNRLFTHFVNLRIPTILLTLPALLVMEVGTLVFATRSGWGKEKLRAWWFFFKPSTWQWVLERRAAIRRIRVVTDKEILSHMSGSITNQEVENPILTKLVNPFLQLYFNVLRVVIWW